MHSRTASNLRSPDKLAGMRAMVGAKDWSETPLGPAEHWPQSLKTAVDMALGCEFPMVVLWGRDLTQIYNDSYREIMAAKHPAGLGQPNRECWPEIWHINAPIYDRVFAGEAITNSDQSYPLERNGHRENVFFTLSYSPIHDETGAIGGVLVTLLDNTQQHCMERARAPATGRLEQHARRYDALLQALPDLVCILDPEHRFTYVNQALLDVWGKTREQAIGKNWRDLPYEPWLAEQHNREAERVLATGESIRNEVPFVGAHGRRVYDYIMVPIFDANGRVEAIGSTTRDVTDRRKREQQSDFLVSLGDALRPVRDSAAIMALASKALGRQLGVGRCGYGEVDESGEFFTVERDWTDGDMASMAGRIRMRDFGEDIHRDFLAGRTIRIQDPLSDARTQGAEGAYAEVGQVRAGIGAPLVKNGRLVAIFYVHQTNPRDWTAGEVALVEDVAERTWEAVGRARAEAALQEANRAKDEFLAMLGHELRNPLAPITTALELMRLRQPDVLTRERGIIEAQVRHMTALVDDLFDISRITRGKVELTKAPIEIGDIIRQAIETAHPLLEQHEQRVRVSVEAGIVVDADQRRLIQVFSNLLTNAAKYSPPRRTVNVTALVEENEVVVRVRDQGIGIEPALLPRVFDLFAQSEQTLDRSQGGLGLGLAIVRNLVAIHGGNVRATSAGRDRGSEFIVRLPLSASRPTCPREHAAAPRAAETASGLEILIVDDYAHAAESLAALLEAHGHRPTIAQDGPAALEAARKSRPEIALIDIGLPIMDGYELAGRLRRTPGLERLPLVALTGYGQESDRQRAREAGFSAHIVKPVNMERLRETITWLAAGSASDLGNG